jgi:gliding motility-associated-like protein
MPVVGFATHNRSGEITYRQTGINTVEIKIVTYTKISGSSGAADRPDLTVNWGDGSPAEVINRDPTQTGLVFTDIKRNVYIGTHTYPGANPPGRPYVVSMQDPNRNDNILNINNGNSVNVTFYLQTEVFLFNPTFFGFNSSPILLEPPVDFGVVGQVFQHTPNGFDPDGDSIAYELISPMSDRGVNVPGYISVDLVGPTIGPQNVFTFDVLTGLFTWTSPQRAGEYNIAILVKSYRNGQYIGGIVRDIQIKIENAQNTPPVIETVEEICVQAGELIEFDVETYDLDQPLQSVELTATGGPLSLANSPATFTSVSGIAPQFSPLRSTFRWQTTCEHIQKNTWQMVFKAKDNYNTPPLATFKVVRIKIIGPPAQNLQAAVSPTAATLTWDAPYACDNATGFFGFTVWRKEGCDNFMPDSCTIGLDGTGYTKISTNYINTPVGGSYQYVDNTIQNGVVYSYRVLPEFATPIFNNGNVVNFQSPVYGVTSEQVCIETREDLPTILNVDVEQTSPTNGEILVRWARPNPKELDTTIYLPPYRYELYQSDDMGGTNFNTTPVYVSPNAASFSTALDTFFVSTGLNTLDNAYSYHILFFSNGDTIGQTKDASSVYLEVAATDAKNSLTWSEIVPWTNTRYVVYEETPLGSSIYTPLDTVSTNQYEHTGLTNGQEYCYRVKSIGSYNTVYLPDTLLNKSQRACGTPLDTIAPCPLDISSIVGVSSCDLVMDDANNPDRQPCSGNITSVDFLYNEIKWSNVKRDTCSDDVARFKVYFAPYCNGEYTLVFESQDLTDTVFQHVPSADNLAGCYYITSIDSLEVNGGGNESLPSDVIQTDNCPFYDLPNTFTPNGDGFNDLFTPCLELRYIQAVDFKVTNRWGQVVFQTNDPNIEWDGKDSNTGQDVAEGVYFYTCNVQQNCISCDAVQTLTGTIHLLRGN